jgi:hypothetical protein
MNRYETATALRRALEDRLMALVGKEGGGNPAVPASSRL